ncbi:MAG: agmatine deiminase family protein [Bacteroidales bacterium]|jgi:agmatine/peptidylarginine deiminase|nr:agmatine deiminase family protein [Bacteroidales bacterium]
MKKQILLSFLIVCFSISVNGQNNKDNTNLIQQKRTEALKKLEAMTEKEFVENFKKYHAKVPTQKVDAKHFQKNQKEIKKDNQQKAALSVPDDMIFPGEWEEVQAILMSWMYDSYTVNGNNYAEPVFDGKGFDYTSSSYDLVDIYSVPDVASNSPYAKIFAQLADGIQQYTQVWINIWDAADSNLIKNYMTSCGTPLTNYRFFINPGNSFWYRDCGPVAFYYGDEDSIAFMDFEYYGGRPLDDKIAIFIGEQAGFPVYTNTIEYEGGNILLDGAGTLFTSSAVYSNNQDYYGLYVQDTANPYDYNVEYKTPLTQQQVKDSLTHLLNLTRCLVFPSLLYDGGTGHVDLYMDMWDENTFVSTKHPDVMANLSDPKKVESNMDSITKLLSMHNSFYYNTRIPLPTKDNGSWYTSQAQYNNTYTRSYSNHTFVNEAIIQPVFHTGTSGYEQGDSAAIEIMKDRYPGYEFKEIDVRSFDGFGGAIHCITKQIPTENPLRIYHNPLRWWNTASFGIPTISAIIQNKSGIDTAIFYYRNSGESSWNSINLNSQGNNLYTLNLNTILINNNAIDTLEYYIEATSNNGKTMTKPITAPKGYYKCVYGYWVDGINEDPVYVSLTNIASVSDMNIGEFYPNPAQDVAKLQITGGLKEDIVVKIVSVKGQVLYSDILKEGTTEFELNTQNFHTGIYWAMFGINGNTTARKIVITK